MENKEIWRPVPGLEETFEVNIKGEVRNKHTLNTMSPQKSGSPYIYYMLYDPKLKRKKKHYQHRLIALWFVPNPYKYHEVNHIDGNKHNNDVNNLEWVNPSLNQKHAIATGLRTYYFREGDTNGEKNANAKLTWEQVDEIRAWAAKNPRTIKDMRTRAKKYGISFKTIYEIIKNKTWLQEKRNL